MAVDALFDTGSDISIIRDDIYDLYLHHLPLDNDVMVIKGLGHFKVKTMGSLQLDVEIDGQLFNLKFHIIPKGSLGFQAILGSNIFKQATVQIGEDGIIVKSKRKADVDSWLMNIAIDDDEDRIDVEHIENALVKNKVGELIRNYTPNKTEDVDIKMKIILRNDEPVYQRARRLSEPQRLEVDKQIAEWLKKGIVRES